MVRVSIILPNYNHEAFLTQRLESIYNQTLQDFEVILLDDASTDDSLTILNTYKEHPKTAHFAVNEKNSGSTFKQWQKGIDLAKGEFIWIAESDDYCELNFLETLIDKLLINDKILLAYSSTMNVDDNNKNLGLNTWAQKMYEIHWEKGFICEGKCEVKSYLRYRNIIPNTSAVITRKEVWNSINIPIYMNYCGDWYIWLEMFKKGKVTFINKPLNFFRKHDKTTRVTKNYIEEQKRFLEYFYIIKKNSSFFSRILNLKKYFWIIDQWLVNANKYKIKDALSIKMPIELYIVFIWRYFKGKIKKLL